eukprot:scaffold170253_cov49-Prasinocladus_malaysianus.AAC.1
MDNLPKRMSSKRPSPMTTVKIADAARQSLSESTPRQPKHRHSCCLVDTTARAGGVAKKVSARSLLKLHSIHRQRNLKDGAIKLLRFDREIQTLSDFGSPMEKWLLDIEEDISRGPNDSHNGRQSVRQIMSQSTLMRKSIA